MNLTIFTVPFVAIALAGCATGPSNDTPGQDAYDRNAPTNVSSPDAPNNTTPAQTNNGNMDGPGR